jgi:hypothetical protein
MAQIGRRRYKSYRAFVVSVALGIAVPVGFGTPASTSKILKAARAPYLAIMRRDARALCADFTIKAARRLADSVSKNTNCYRRVSVAFARSAPFEPKSRLAALKAVKASDARQRGDFASAVITYGKSGTAVTLRLVKVGASWRISTPPTLGLIKGCVAHGHLTEHCQKNARVLFFAIGYS